MGECAGDPEVVARACEGGGPDADESQDQEPGGGQSLMLELVCNNNPFMGLSKKQIKKNKQLKKARKTLSRYEKDMKALEAKMAKLNEERQEAQLTVYQAEYKDECP